MHEVTRGRLKGLAGGAALGVTALLAAASLTEEGRSAMGRLARRVTLAVPPETGESVADDVGGDVEEAIEPTTTTNATPSPAHVFAEAWAKVGRDAERILTGEGTSIEMMLSMADLRDAATTLSGQCVPNGGGRRWRHLKRGHEYDEVSRATLHFIDRPPVEGESLTIYANAHGHFAVRQDASGREPDGIVVARPTLQVATRPLRQGDVLVGYRGRDGDEWARLREEFEDGRFERL